MYFMHAPFSPFHTPSFASLVIRYATIMIPNMQSQVLLPNISVAALRHALNLLDQQAHHYIYYHHHHQHQLRLPTNPPYKLTLPGDPQIFVKRMLSCRQYISLLE